MRHCVCVCVCPFFKAFIILSPPSQRDLDFVITYDFDGELMDYHISQDYHMRWSPASTVMCTRYAVVSNSDICCTEPLTLPYVVRTYFIEYDGLSYLRDWELFEYLLLNVCIYSAFFCEEFITHGGGGGILSGVSSHVAIV